MRVDAFSQLEGLDSRVGVALGGLAAVLLPAMLVPLRDDLYSPALALLLVLPVLLGAVTGGRLGGVVTAVVATMSYDFFLTRPYLSLTIDSRNDVETAIVFLVVALVVGTVAAGARRSFVRAERGHLELAAIHRVAEVAVTEARPSEVVETARKELVRVLRLEGCEFDESTDPGVLPVLEHTGTLIGKRHRYVKGGFTLPTGAELHVVFDDQRLGRFVLHGNPDVPVTADARIAAVVIADQVASVLAADDCSKREERA
jgi:hypothetical protein